VDAADGYAGSKMIETTSLEGVLMITPRIFKDDRGTFTESFSAKQFDKATGGRYTFVQDNQSVSKKNVLRGLHFQNPPFEQGKLVRVSKGSVIDVAVDIRKHSSTYGQHIAVLLSAENNRQLWIPPGFAHGFVALEEDTVFCYKCTEYYAPQAEDCIAWNDPDLNIDWGVRDPIVSSKDSIGKEFCKFATQF